MPAATYRYVWSGVAVADLVRGLDPTVTPTEAQPFPLPTIDITLSDNGPVPKKDLDEAMVQAGWGFLEIAPAPGTPQQFAFYDEVLNGNFLTTASGLQPTNLAFPVKAGEKWEVEIELTDTNGVGGVLFGITLPAGSTMLGWLYSYDGSTGLIQEALTPGGVTPAMHFGSGNGGPHPDHFSFSFTAGADGACTLQAGAGTGGQTLTILAGSKLRAAKTNGV